MLLLDWKKSRIILVDPAIWRRYSHGTTDLRPVYDELVAVLRGWGAEVEMLGRADAPLDIWIRDWGCVEGVFFRYAPDYAKGLYSRAAVNRAIFALNSRIHVPFRLRLSPLVLDGGNLVHNGRVAIVTRKVFLDNPHLSRSEIERAICSLGFERVVFVPVEPGDEIGHADGMCRFLSESVLLVNDYASASMSAFGRKLRRVLRAAKLDAEIVPLPWFCSSGRSDGVPSAVGCYMNFLQLAQGIILPSFAHCHDERALERVAALVKRPVVSVPATPLAKLGGVFNCISLTL
jgi:agmatine deiminase